MRSKRGNYQWNLLLKNPAPQERNSLAQHGAAGGMLGRAGNRSESRRDGRRSHACSYGPTLLSGIQRCEYFLVHEGKLFLTCIILFAG